MLKNRIEIIGYKILKRVVLSLPLKLRYALAAALGVVSYWIIPKRRKICYENLNIAFPEKSRQEKKKIAIESYKNIAKTFFEVLWNEKLNAEEEGIEILKNSLSKGKGAILVSLHLGNWEAGGMLLSKYSKGFFPIARRQRNREFDAELNKEREKRGIYTIIKGSPESPREIIKALKTGGILGLISDQYGKDVEINFFGKKTSANSGPAVLAAKFGTPVLLAYDIRTKDNHTKVIVQEELQLIKSDNKEKDVVDNMQMIYDKFEEIIRNYPEQWFWQHRRWR